MTSARASAAYRIAFTYAAAFAASILLLGIAVYFAADAEFRQQRDESLNVELADLSREGGGDEMIRELGEREQSRAVSTFGYALFDRQGHRIAGALDTPRPGLGFSTITFNDPQEGPDKARAKAIDLADGERLVVAVDSEAIETIDETILTLFGVAFLAVVVIGVGGAILLGRYLRARLNAISATANRIVAGDTAQRIPVGPRGDEFDAVAVALNTMLDRIAGLMENLRQVSSDVAHDLRTPLVRLRARLEQVGTVDGAAQRAIEQGDELLRLFGAILQIAEVEGGGLASTFVRVDLSTLVDDVCEGFLPALTDSGRSLRWKVEPDIAVAGNRDLLAQALANLLDNARVHTPTGCRVQVLLDGAAGWARLSVEDDGPGVPATDHDNITRRFFRGEASRTTPGNGLGLSLVSAVASAHGGEVAIGAPRRGLRVTVVIPQLPA